MRHRIGDHRSFQRNLAGIVLLQAADNVGPGGQRLGLQRLQFKIHRHFRGDHSPHIRFDGNLVNPVFPGKVNGHQRQRGFDGLGVGRNGVPGLPDIRRCLPAGGGIRQKRMD
ncbi:hypothetical protein D3C76_1435630 [compost metagenome]